MKFLFFLIALFILFFNVFLVFKDFRKTNKRIVKTIPEPKIVKTIPEPKKRGCKKQQKREKNNKNFNQKVKIFFRNKRERS